MSNQEAMEEKVVIFRLGDDEYGISIDQVEKVESMMPITPVPRSPEFVEGIINLRGEVVPVISLRRRLGLADRAADENTHIVVVRVDDQLVGMLVDAISHVLTLEHSAIQPAEQVIGSINTSYLRGVARWEDKLVVLMDLESTLDANV